MKRPLALLLLLTALVPPTHAAPRAAAAVVTDTLRLSLDQAVERALENGTAMQAARAGVGIARGRIVEARSEALPRITSSVGYNRKFDSIFRGVTDTDTSGLGDLFSNTPFGAVHGWSLDLTARQLLWSGGRVGAGLQAARAVNASATRDRDQTAADVTLATQDAYWSALYARAVVGIAREGRDRAREHLRQVELLHRQGSRSEYDLLQAQVDAANQEPLVVNARAAADLAMLELKRTLGLPLAQPLVLATPLAFGETLPVPLPEGTPNDASRRPAVLGADALVEARQAALRAERAGWWPELAATATVSHQAFPADGTPERTQFQRSVDATVRLEWPLFTGFRTLGSVQRASQELALARAQREETRRRAEVELAEARLGVEQALSTLVARRGTARLAERAHRLAEVRWRNGLATQLEVSDARLRMQDAQVHEVLALKDYRLSLARLERAAGTPIATRDLSLDELAQRLPPREDD